MPTIECFTCGVSKGEGNPITVKYDGCEECQNPDGTPKIRPVCEMPAARKAEARKKERERRALLTDHERRIEDMHSKARENRRRKSSTRNRVAIAKEEENQNGSSESSASLPDTKEGPRPTHDSRRTTRGKKHRGGRTESSQPRPTKRARRAHSHSSSFRSKQ